MIFLLTLIPAHLQGQASPDHGHILGAAEIIRNIKDHPPSDPKADPLAALTAKSNALKVGIGKLSPQAATDAWLDLYGNWQQVDSTQDWKTFAHQDHWQGIMMPVLPAPASWPLIRQGLDRFPKDKAAHAEAFFDELLGKDDQVLRYLESLRDPNADPAREDFSSPEARITDAELPIALRTSNLDLLAKIYLLQARGDRFNYPGVPDLARIFGKQSAEALIKAILEKGKSSQSDWIGAETKTLAKSILISDLANLKSPQWNLIESLDDYPLASAQVAKFGVEVIQGGSQPALVYALGLTKEGQIDKAIQFLSSPHSVGYYSYSHTREQLEELFALMSKLLDRKRLPSLASTYVTVGESLGRTGETLQRLNGWLSEPNLTDEDRKTYLVLRGGLEAETLGPKQAISDYEESIKLGDIYQAPSALLNIAIAAGDADAVKFIEETAKGPNTELKRHDFFGAYRSMHLWTQAQEAAISAVQDVHNVNMQAEGMGRLLDAYPNTGLQLASLYYQAGQADQIITLLNEYPKWGAEDISELLDYQADGNYRCNCKGNSLEPLGFYVAWALDKTGDHANAVNILRRLLARFPSDDGAYNLLTDLEGQAASTFYDKLIQANPLEARPLIWKADLLFKMGKTQEAETAVRAAIALDPSDADGSGGWRQNAYAVLGRILEKEGKAGEAAECAKILQAAELTSDANMQEEALLYSTAVPLYQKALSVYPKDAVAQLHCASCLQSLGKEDEAAVEYSKSLQLILSSEGEANGADPGDDYSFHDATLRKKALVQLENLNQSHPNNPGVLLALGRLKEVDANFEGALESYESAVKADPLYERAWIAILQLADKRVATKAQMLEATLRAIQLGDGAEIPDAAYSAAGDYAAIWNAFHIRAASMIPVATDPIHPLRASKLAIAAGAKRADVNSSDSSKTPGESLGSIQQLQSLFP